MTPAVVAAGAPVATAVPSSPATGSVSPAVEPVDVVLPRIEPRLLTASVSTCARKETPPASPVVLQAQDDQAAQQDQLQAQEIYYQMALERQKSQQRMAVMLAELQTAIFEMWDSVLTRREKVFDSAAEAWVKVLSA